MINSIAVPLGKLLFYIYDIVNSYGLSIVVFTILVKLILLPLTIKQTKSMKQMQELNPKIKALQKKYGHDKQKLNEKTMELYRQHNVNPFASGCLPLLLQLPVLFALFQVLRLPEVYVFTPKPMRRWAKAFMDKGLIGIIKFFRSGKLYTSILAAVTTYYQSKMVAPKSAEGNPEHHERSNAPYDWVFQFQFSCRCDPLLGAQQPIPNSAAVWTEPWRDGEGGIQLITGNYVIKTGRTIQEVVIGDRRTEYRP